MIPEPRVDLKLLHSFVAVSETLHFGKAAEQSFLSVGTISTRIKDLEQRLGYAVFERTSREVSLTPEGAELLAEIKPILEALARIGDNAGRRIRISCNFDTMIPPVLAAIERLKSTGVEIDIRTAYDNEASSLLDSNSVDLAISWSKLGEAGAYRSTQLSSLEVFVLAQADDPLARHDVVTPDDIADHKVVLFARPLAPDVFDELTSWVERAGRNALDYLTPIFQSQAGMAGTAATKHKTVTFTTSVHAAIDDLVARPIDPPIFTPIRATTRRDDLDLLNEFTELVQDY